MPPAPLIPKPPRLSGAATPAWLRPLLLALTAMLLLTWFTGEVADTDIWLHLMTGPPHARNPRAHRPRPFSYTSNLNSAAYPGEAKTRYFNLTHEWLAQIIMYVIHAATGFPGLVLLRALLLIAFCGLVGPDGLVAHRGFSAASRRAIAAGAVAINFQQSRPFLVTFVLLAVTMAILERRRWMWALPGLHLLGQLPRRLLHGLGDAGRILRRGADPAPAQTAVSKASANCGSSRSHASWRPRSIPTASA